MTVGVIEIVGVRVGVIEIVGVTEGEGLMVRGEGVTVLVAVRVAVIEGDVEGVRVVVELAVSVAVTDGVADRVAVPVREGVVLGEMEALPMPLTLSALERVQAVSIPMVAIWGPTESGVKVT